MRNCTLLRCHVLCVFLLPVFAAVSLFASPPVEKQPKKQIRIARKLVYPVSLMTKSSLAAASLKYLQSQKNTQPSRSPGSARIPKSRPRVRPSSTRPTTSQGVYQYLARKRLSVAYSEMPFGQVMDELRSQMTINMIVYWPQIELDQIDRDTPVTLELENVSAYTVLNAVLNYVSSSSLGKLDFVVNQGVLEIGLKGQLTERRVVRVYYIADLMQERSDYFNSIMGGGQNGGGRFGNNSNQRNQSSGRGGSENTRRNLQIFDRFR